MTSSIPSLIKITQNEKQHQCLNNILDFVEWNQYEYNEELKRLN